MATSFDETYLSHLLYEALILNILTQRGMSQIKSNGVTNKNRDLIASFSH